MIRILLATLDCCYARPHFGLGSALMVSTVTGMHRFNTGKSGSEGIGTAVAGWFNPDQLMTSGRCGVTLPPT